MEIEFLFEDLGEGTPVPAVRVFDGQRAEKTSGGRFIAIENPGAVFPDHTLFVQAGSLPPKCVNYRARFEYCPAGWSMSVYPPRLVDIRETIRNSRDPIVKEIFEDHGRPVENPGDILQKLAKSLNYVAIEAIKGRPAQAEMAGFLLGLGRVLQSAGRPEALKVLETAEQVAKKAKSNRLATGALRGQEAIFAAKRDKAALARVRKRLATLKTPAVVVRPR